MTDNDADSPNAGRAGAAAQADPALVIATILRPEGITGVHTHFRQLGRYLDRMGRPAPLVTPFSWGRPIIGPVFGLRRVLERCSGPANVWWYRHWHEVFLHRALRRRLAGGVDGVVYAQGPLAARAALRARRGPQQRVVLAVHFRISQADEWVDKGQISRAGAMFGQIRSLEREVIPQLDGLVYVSRWGRDALLSWLPEAAAVPSAVIFNFVAPLSAEPPRRPIADLVTVGNLEAVKNHRYLLEVLAEARAQGHQYTLDIFGEGPLEGSLQNQIKSLGLQQQVRLRGFRSDVRDFLSGYRACVHASYSESLPLAIIESMAAGLPIVAGASGGVSELFDEGVEGRFWPLDDPGRAATVLTGLMADESARRSAGLAALARFEREFDADVIAPRLLSFVMHPKAVAVTGH